MRRQFRPMIIVLDINNKMKNTNIIFLLLLFCVFAVIGRAQPVELKQSETGNFELHIAVVNVYLKVFIDEKLAVSEKLEYKPDSAADTISSEAYHKIFKFSLAPGKHLIRVEADNNIGFQTEFEINGAKHWGLLSYSTFPTPQKPYSLEIYDHQIMYQ